MKRGTGVLVGAVTGGWELVGVVDVTTTGVSLPVALVGERVVVGSSVGPDERMRRMDRLSIYPSATELGFSKSPMVER